MHVGLSCFLTVLSDLYDYVSQKDFMCGSSIPTLKSPKINIFSYFEECKSKNYLMLPDDLLS